VNGRVHTQVHSYPNLDYTDSIKDTCDPLVLPSYRVNPQGEDDMSGQCDNHEVSDFKVHRLLATGVKGSARGHRIHAKGVQLRRVTLQLRR
jgi:hypothetical protein